MGYTTAFFGKAYAGTHGLAGKVRPPAIHGRSLLSPSKRDPRTIDNQNIAGGGYPGSVMAVKIAKIDHRGNVVHTPVRTVSRQVRPHPIPAAQRPRQTTFFGRPIFRPGKR